MLCCHFCQKKYCIKNEQKVKYEYKVKLWQNTRNGDMEKTMTMKFLTLEPPICLSLIHCNKLNDENKLQSMYEYNMNYNVP